MSKNNKLIKRLYIARHNNRVTNDLIIQKLFTNIVELHGDREGHDDSEISTRIGLLGNLPWTIISLCNHKNNGSAMPYGYRKVLRIARLSEKFQRPILYLVDTPGAACNIQAEKLGQSAAIADSLYTLLQLRVPQITIITGQGGSGGAIALSCGDKLYMLQNSIFSVISPEGCSEIIWHDKKHVEDAAKLLGMFPEELYKNSIIDGVVPCNTSEQVLNLEKIIRNDYEKLKSMDQEELLERRMKKHIEFR